MYVMVSIAIPPADGTPGVETPDNLPDAYRVPNTLTTAVTRTAIRDAHHGVSGARGLGLGGVFIVYFKRVVLLPMNNNGESTVETSSTTYDYGTRTTCRFRTIFHCLCG